MIQLDEDVQRTLTFGRFRTLEQAGLMQNRIVETLLPTTMVGSYPRPHWFTHQLLGRDVRVAFKEVQHEEAYHDAVATVIRDQEEAGLDIVTDGNMWYDDYVGVIGSFCWYMYERIGGFEHAREPRSEEHTSELQSRENLVCRLLLEKKKIEAY